MLHRGPLREDPEFQLHYIRHLQPLEVEFERHRVRARRRAIATFSSAAILWTGAVALVWLQFRPETEVALWASGIAALMSGVLLGFSAYLPLAGHSDRLKEQILPRIVPLFGDLHFEWQPKNLEIDAIVPNGLLPEHSREEIEDLIEGSYRGIPLRAAEIKLTKSETRRSSSGSSSTSTATVFSGLLLQLTLPRARPGTVVAATQEFSDDSQLTQRLQDRGLVVQGEFDGFELLATPDAPKGGLNGSNLTAQLQQFARRLDAEQLAASFSGDQLVVLVGKEQDYFELPLDSTDFQRDAEMVGEQLDGMLSVIDLLDIEGRDDASPLRSPSHLPEPRPGMGADESKSRYDVNTWGCLFSFLMFVLLLSGFGAVLRDYDEPDLHYLFSALATLLSVLALSQLWYAATLRSATRLVFGLLFLGGTYWLVSFVGSDLLFPRAPLESSALAQPAGQTETYMAEAPLDPVAPTPPEQPATSWLASPTPDPSQPLSDSSIELLASSLDTAPLEHGNLLTLEAKLVNREPHDLVLDVEATLNRLALFVDASDGAYLPELSSPSREQTIVWPPLLLPAGRTGTLEISILVDLYFNEYLMVDLLARDPRHSFETRLPFHLEPDDQEGGAPMWWIAIVVSFMMSMVLLFVAQQRAQGSLFRSVTTRLVCGYFALLLGTFAVLSSWSTVKSWAFVERAECTILDRRYDDQARVAVRYETPDGTIVSSGSAGHSSSGSLSDIAPFLRGDVTECWYRSDAPDRVALKRGSGIVVPLITTAFGIGAAPLLWVAFRRGKRR